MSNAVNSDACVLCGSNAEWLPGNYAISRDYRCSNSDCGVYRVANDAIDAVKGAVSLRDTARQKAKSAQGSGRVLVISRSGAGVTLDIVDPSSIRFFRR